MFGSGGLVDWWTGGLVIIRVGGALAKISPTQNPGFRFSIFGAMQPCGSVAYAAEHKPQSNRKCLPTSYICR